MRATKKPALIGKRAMTRVSRAIEKGETFGFIKVLVDAETQQILGAPSSAPAATRRFTASSPRCMRASPSRC